MVQTKQIRRARYACVLLSAFLLVSGMLLLFFPSVSSRLYGIDNLDLLESSTTHAMGVRQFVIGLMIGALVFSHQIKALGMLMILSALVPFADFFVFAPEVGWFSALRHLTSVPFIVGLGIYLLVHIRKTAEREAKHNERP